MVSDAIQPDRIRFYRDLTLPLGVSCRSLSPLHLLMAAPQMLASVIGVVAVRPPDPVPVHVDDDRPDPHRLDRGRPLTCGCGSAVLRKWIVPVAARLCAYVTNVAWSPSPIGNGYGVWRRDNAHAEDDAGRRRARARRRRRLVVVQLRSAPLPARAVVRLAEPVLAGVLGQRGAWRADCKRFPSASDIDYLVLDLSLFVG